MEISSIIFIDLIYLSWLGAQMAVTQFGLTLSAAPSEAAFCWGFFAERDTKEDRALPRDFHICSFKAQLFVELSNSQLY